MYVVLRILRYIFSVLGLILALYGLMTKDFSYSPYMIMFLGLMFFVISLETFKKEQKMYGWLYMVIFLFSLFVSLQSFILN